MSSTTTYGYKLPANGDRGSTFFPDLEHNISRVDGHTHDGSDSALIPAKNISKSTQDIASGSWVLVAGGHYRQLVTTPSGYTVDSSFMKFYFNGGSFDGQQVFLKVEKASSTTYYVYINDNTQALKVVYG